MGRSYKPNKTKQNYIIIYKTIGQPVTEIVRKESDRSRDKTMSKPVTNKEHLLQNQISVWVAPGLTKSCFVLL